MPATPIEDEALESVIGGAQMIAAFPDVCLTPPEFRPDPAGDGTTEHFFRPNPAGDGTTEHF